MSQQPGAALESAIAQIALLNRCVTETNDAVAHVERLFEQHQLGEFWRWAENVERIIPTYSNAVFALDAAAQAYAQAGGAGPGLQGTYPYPDLAPAYQRLDAVLRRAHARYDFITQYRRSGNGRVRLLRATFHEVPSARPLFERAVRQFGGTPV